MGTRLSTPDLGDCTPTKRKRPVFTAQTSFDDCHASAGGIQRLANAFALRRAHMPLDMEQKGFARRVWNTVHACLASEEFRAGMIEAHKIAFFICRWHAFRCALQRFKRSKIHVITVSFDPESI